MDNYARVKILKMLEEGKISSDDALRLIEAIDDEPPIRENKDKFDIDYEFEADEIEIEAEKLEETAEKLEKEAEKLIEKIEEGLDTEYEKLSEKAKKLREMADKKRVESDEFKEKAEHFRKCAEDISEDISKKINEKLEGFNFGDFFNFGFDIRDSVKKEKTFCVSENMEITVRNKNGNIKVSKSEDKAYAVFHIKSRKEAEEVMEDIIIKNEDKLEIDLMFKESEYIHTRTRVDVELFLPFITYGNVKLSTTNGSVETGLFKASEVSVFSTNGRINVYETTAKAIIAQTTNGKALGYRNKCAKLNISSTNGSVKEGDNECEEIELHTTNGSINSHNSVARMISLSTTNGSIRSEGNEAETHFLHTHNAGIVITKFRPGNDKAKVEARTSNGTIRIENEEDIKLDFVATVGKNQKVKGEFKEYSTRGKEHIGTLKKGSDGKKRIMMDIKTSLGNVEFS